MGNQVQAITADGDYDFEAFAPGDRVAVSVFHGDSGNFGGGTITFYEHAPGEDIDTALRAVPSSATSVIGGFEFVFTGNHKQIRATMAGSTTPDLQVRVCTIN